MKYSSPILPGSDRADDVVKLAVSTDRLDAAGGIEHGVAASEGRRDRPFDRQSSRAGC